MVNKYLQNTFFHLILLTVVSFLTFIPVLRMYFYSDDYGDLYTLTHGGMRYNDSWLSPDFRNHLIQFLYNFFGLEPIGYYIVGVAVFITTVILFYFFARNLFQNKLLGLVSGLIYATTLVGVDTVFMITTFYVESGYPVTLTLLILLFLLLKFFQQKLILYYILTAMLLHVFLSLQPKRGFLLMPVIHLFDYLINAKKFLPSFGTFLRQIPLFIIFLYAYAQVPSIIDFLNGDFVIKSSTIDVDAKIETLLKGFLDIRPLYSLVNVILNVPLALINYQNVDISILDHGSFWTILTVFFILILVILAWRLDKLWGKSLLFSLAWIYFNILGFYVFSSPGISEATNRTVTLSAPGYALFMTVLGLVVYSYAKKILGKRLANFGKIFNLIVILFLILSFGITFFHFEDFNQRRTKYTRVFFDDLKGYYPEIPANSRFYIEPKNTHYKSRLYNIYKGNSYGVGGTLAIYYGHTYKDLDLFHDYEEVQGFVGKDIKLIDHVFAFYYDENGLTDITYDIRSSLENSIKY